MMLMTDGQPRSPQGFKVAPTSYDKIEQLAEGFRRYLPVCGPNAPFRIDAWELLEKTLPQADYMVRVGEIDQMGEVAGMTMPDHKLIIIRQDIYDRLEDDHVYSRSTVVHEAAHNFLQHSVTLQRGPAGQHRFCEDSEWQAKALTAAIMMPVEACRRAGTARALAVMCGTSIEAAGYRLDRLRKSGVIA